MLLAIVAALCSAATFALGAALQHRAVSDGQHEPAQRMLARIAQRKSWLAGLALSAVAFGLHGVALAHGDLTLVQPIIVSGIVFAVLIRSALDRHWPSRTVLTWLVVTWAGLALFVAVRASRTVAASGTAHEVPTVIVGVLAAGAAVATARMVGPTRRGVLLAAGSGALFGLVAGLLKLVTVQLRGGIGQALGHWSLWVLIPVGLAAVLINQRAYHVARLSVTSPVLNISQVLVAIAFGFVVFGERLSHTPLLVCGEVVGLALMITGVWRLARLQAEDQHSEPATAEPVSERG